MYADMGKKEQIEEKRMGNVCVIPTHEFLGKNVHIYLMHSCRFSMSATIAQRFSFEHI